MADTIVYADKLEMILCKSAKKSARAVDHVLPCTWLNVVDTDGNWIRTL